MERTLPFLSSNIQVDQMDCIQMRWTLFVSKRGVHEGLELEPLRCLDDKRTATLEQLLTELTDTRSPRAFSTASARSE